MDVFYIIPKTGIVNMFTKNNKFQGKREDQACQIQKKKLNNGNSKNDKTIIRVAKTGQSYVMMNKAGLNDSRLVQQRNFGIPSFKPDNWKY